MKLEICSPGKCGYCLRDSDEVRKVQLRLADLRWDKSSGVWGTPVWLCTGCRVVLAGYWKYAVKEPTFFDRR